MIFILTARPLFLCFPYRDGLDSQITCIGLLPLRSQTSSKTVNCQATADVRVVVARNIVQVQRKQAVHSPVVPVATVSKI